MASLALQVNSALYGYTTLPGFSLIDRVFNTKGQFVTTVERETSSVAKDGSKTC